MDKDKMEKDKLAELDWIQLRKDMDAAASADQYSEEFFFDRLKRKMSENLLVPIGMAATVAALSFGLVSFKRGNKVMSQKMMRARVLAQGFTIVVAVGGTMIAAAKTKSENLEKLNENEQTAGA